VELNWPDGQPQTIPAFETSPLPYREGSDTDEPGVRIADLPDELFVRLDTHLVTSLTILAGLQVGDGLSGWVRSVSIDW
jgi:hypothetical protein